MIEYQIERLILLNDIFARRTRDGFPFGYLTLAGFVLYVYVYVSIAVESLPSVVLMIVVNIKASYNIHMTSSRISLYHIRGTHYSCAHTLGVLTREAIRHRISDDFGNLSKLFAFARTDYGRRSHGDFINVIRVVYPRYWDIIVGLADGSKIALQQIIVLNFLNDTQTAQQLFEENSINETGEKGCTTVLLNRSDSQTYSLLHNEDLAEADIQSSEYDHGKRFNLNEKYLAYCYTGTIPGKIISKKNTRMDGLLV